MKICANLRHLRLYNSSNSLAGIGSGRVVVDEVLSLGHGFGQGGTEHCQHRGVLLLGGLHEIGKDADEGPPI